MKGWGVSERGAWASAGCSPQLSAGVDSALTAANDEGSTMHGYFSSYCLYSV